MRGSADILLKQSCPACSGHVKFPEEGIGLTIDCPHCSQPFLLEDPQAIYDWMQKQKFPLDRAGVVKSSEAKLNEFRLVGIEFVSILGCNNPGDDCEACLALKDRKLEIESAPPLPLPECDKKFCKCLYIAAE
jgi:hypothetical protein